MADPRAAIRSRFGGSRLDRGLPMILAVYLVVVAVIAALELQDLVALAEGARRPLRYGDMLVLVRRRGNAFDAVIQALKHAGIPVAGADRLKLTEHIAIIDLMNLADGFNIFQHIGPNYLGGIMDNAARVAIHYSHRVGALITAVYARGGGELPQELSTGYRQACGRLSGRKTRLFLRSIHRAPHGIRR